MVGTWNQQPRSRFSSASGANPPSMVEFSGLSLGKHLYDEMLEAANRNALGLWRRHVQLAIDTSAIDCWREADDGDVVPWHLHFDDDWIEFDPVGDLAAVRWHGDYC